jgi:protein-tyrosine phosphatase
VRDDYPTSADVMLRAVDQLRQALDQAVIPLTVHSGAELAIEWLPRLSEPELRRLTLAGGGRYVLVETPYHGWPTTIVDGLLRIRRSGCTPVLAHPERNAVVQESPSVLAPLVRGGTLVQVTAASLDGRLGRGSRNTALRLIEAGLAHLMASDAHMPDLRMAGMRSALDAIRDESLARWLVADVPRALVESRDPPPRPSSS